MLISHRKQLSRRSVCSSALAFTVLILVASLASACWLPQSTGTTEPASIAPVAITQYVPPSATADTLAVPTPTVLPKPSQTPLTWPFSPFSGPAPSPPVQNFGVIEEGIVCRSAQPNDEEYRYLASQGFKSVISFRREIGNEEQRILSLGYKFYLFLDIEDETQPTDQQAEEFLAFVTNKDHWPIVMHCKVGVGRTGTMAALIRYSIDGWPMNQAMDEALIYRGGTQLVTPQVQWLQRWAATHSPGSHRPKVLP
jgi:protein-tyrosine phosphatase